MSNLRTSYPGAFHHVFTRCNNREALLTPNHLALVLEILRTAKEKFGVKLFTFSLLNNHYHLLLRVGAVSLPKIMHWFNWTCAMKINQRFGRIGHLWQSRFLSPLIEDENYLLRCAIYIDLNPVQAGIVQTPQDWPFGSAARYLTGHPYPWINPLHTELGLEKDARKWRREYKRFLAEAMERNLALRKLIQENNREGAIRWLRNHSQEPIPYRNELSQLLRGRLKRYLRHA